MLTPSLKQTITNSLGHTMTTSQIMERDTLPSSFGSAPDLPNETWIGIFARISKRDLKSIRRVCHAFRDLANPLLFDRVHASPHKVNLRVLNKISKHPTLSLCPRVLVYHAVEFEGPLSLVEFFSRLSQQLLLYMSYASHDSLRFDFVQQELLRGAEQHVRHNEPMENCLHPQYLEIVEGKYNNYLEKCDEQAHIEKSGEFLATICLALAKLVNVRDVDLGARWNDYDIENMNWSSNAVNVPCSPGPLARRWGLFELRPRMLMSGQVRLFNNLISALSISGRPIRRLSFVDFFEIPQHVFDDRSRLSRTFWMHRSAAMKHLEALNISVNLSDNGVPGDWYNRKVDHDGDDYEDDGWDNDPHEWGRVINEVSLLGNVMYVSRKLRHLRVQVSGIELDKNVEFIRFNSFGFPSTLPLLESLELHGGIGTEKDIANFLRAQPRLSFLVLSHVELQEGNWADLVDEIRKSLRLDLFGLRPPIWHKKMVLCQTREWDELDISSKVQDYVVHGGENPIRMLM